MQLYCTTLCLLTWYRRSRPQVQGSVSYIVKRTVSSLSRLTPSADRNTGDIRCEFWRNTLTTEKKSLFGKYCPPREKCSRLTLVICRLCRLKKIMTQERSVCTVFWLKLDYKKISRCLNKTYEEVRVDNICVITLPRTITYELPWDWTLISSEITTWPFKAQNEGHIFSLWRIARRELRPIEDLSFASQWDETEQKGVSEGHPYNKYTYWHLAQGHCPLSISRINLNYFFIQSRVLQNTNRYVDTRIKAGWSFVIADRWVPKSRIQVRNSEEALGVTALKSRPALHLFASIIPTALVSPIMISE